MVKVLLVEDDGKFAQKIIEATNGTEYKIIGPHIGETYSKLDIIDAMDCFDSEKPDIALIDIELASKQMNGIIMAEYIISKRRIPFAFISQHNSRSSPETFEKADRLHPNEYIPKMSGIDTEGILHILDRLNKLRGFYIRTVKPGNNDDVILTSAGLFLKSKKDRLVTSFLPREEIVYISVKGDICRIFPDTTIPNKEFTNKVPFSFIVNKRMKDFANWFTDSLVQQIERNYAVNLRFVAFKEYRTTFGKRTFKAIIRHPNATDKETESSYVEIWVGKTFIPLVREINNGL